MPQTDEDKAAFKAERIAARRLEDARFETKHQRDVFSSTALEYGLAHQKTKDALVLWRNAIADLQAIVDKETSRGNK